MTAKSLTQRSFHFHPRTNHDSSLAGLLSWCMAVFLFVVSLCKRRREDGQPWGNSCEKVLKHLESVCGMRGCKAGMAQYIRCYVPHIGLLCMVTCLKYCIVFTSRSHCRLIFDRLGLWSSRARVARESNHQLVCAICRCASMHGSPAAMRCLPDGWTDCFPGRGFLGFKYMFQTCFGPGKLIPHNFRCSAAISSSGKMCFSAFFYPPRAI